MTTNLRAITLIGALATLFFANAVSAQWRLPFIKPVSPRPSIITTPTDDELAWCPREHPGRYVCEPIDNSPVVDCDDKAWLVCLQFPGSCWMFDFYAPDDDVGGGQWTGHRVVILRNPVQNPDGTWRFCVVEPYGLDPIYCWDSPTDSPSNFPSDDIRRAICQFPGYEWWVDCDQGQPRVNPPFPGDVPYYCDPGEAPWYECGSNRQTRFLCDRFNEYPNMECLPRDIRDCLPKCDELDGGENADWPSGAQGCLPGQTALCRKDDGSLSTRFCCALSGGADSGAWCLVPFERYHLPACAMFIGQECDPGHNTVRDCFEESSPNPFGFDGLLPTTIVCQSCEGSSSGYCWKWPYGHSSSSTSSQGSSSSSSGGNSSQITKP